MRLLFRIFWVGVSAFLVFFLNALAYNPSGDTRYYASEVICTNQKTSHLCTSQTTQSIYVFRQGGDNVTLQQNMNSTYVSETFSKFIGLAFNNSDTYREVLLKIFAVKSAVAALIITLVVYLQHRYRYLRSSVVRSTTGLLSLPFLLQSVAGPYPAGIAILGLLLALMVLVVVGEDRIRLWDTPLLVGCWCISCLVITTNRIDTLAFLLAMMVMFFIRQFAYAAGTVYLNPVVFVLMAISMLTIGFTWLIDDKVLSLQKQVVTGQVTLVPTEISSKSTQLIDSIGLPGDLAFSLMAPITMIDNGTRAFVNATYGPLFFESPQSTLVRFGLITLVVIFVVLAWIPLGISSASMVADTLSRLHAGAPRQKRLATVSLIGLPLLIYFLVPWYVRGIWSLAYVLPIFLILTLASDARRPLHSYEKLGFSVMFASNISAIIAINGQLGDVYVLGKKFPTLVVVLALTASTAALLLGIFKPTKIPEATSVAT